MNTFWKRFLETPDTAFSLFSEMPRFMYFMKDRDLKFVSLNDQLITKIGLPKEEIIGKTDFDLFPQSIAQAFYQDDQAIIESGHPLLNKTELVPSRHGQVDWSLTTKTPLRDGHGTIQGIIGVTRPFSSSGTALDSSSELSPAIQHIKENFHTKCTVKKLAEVSSLSLSAFERKFKKILHVNPTEFIRNARVQHACHLLSQGTTPLADIADQCGFFDQSHLSRDFVRSMNISPLKYRKQYRI